jgi:hypothetical protein
MTVDEFFDKFVGMLEDRLGDDPPPEWQAGVDTLQQAGVAGLPVSAQQLLNDIPAAPAAATGACDYQIAGVSFCLENVTAGECLNLGGIFRRDGTCPVTGDWSLVLPAGASPPSAGGSPGSGSAPPGGP